LRTDALRGFEHDDLASGECEFSRNREAHDTGANYDTVDCFRHLVRYRYTSQA